MFAAYSTSKFAIRGLTQNAGLSILIALRVYFYMLGTRKRWIWGNMASQSTLMRLVRHFHFITHMLNREKN